MSFGAHSVARFPGFGGESDSFDMYGQEVELRNHLTALDITRRAPASALRMAAQAQEICLASGAAELISVDGVEEVMKASKAYSASDILDAGKQDADKFLPYRKTTRKIDGYSA